MPLSARHSFLFMKSRSRQQNKDCNSRNNMPSRANLMLDCLRTVSLDILQRNDFSSARVFLMELLSIVRAVPYGCRAFFSYNLAVWRSRHNSQSNRLRMKTIEYCGKKATNNSKRNKLRSRKSKISCYGRCYNC